MTPQGPASFEEETASEDSEECSSQGREGIEGKEAGEEAETRALARNVLSEKQDPNSEASIGKRKRHVLSSLERAARRDASLRRRRKKLSGNSGKEFSEGWIEFADKKVAKRVAEMLNGNPMGGKKRSAYHYDLWCLKYLPKFKWDNLTEEIAYQNAIRDQKLATEISAAKRERDFYLSRVDRAKAEDAKEERRKKKAEKAEGGEAQQHVPQRKILRAFGQKSVKSSAVGIDKAKALPKSVLSLLAGQQAE